MSGKGGNVKEYPKTLCWSCANAVPDRDGERGCSWSREGKPVEGWTATRRDIRVGATENGKKAESYQVSKCPQFVRDKPRRRKKNVVEEMIAIYKKRLLREGNAYRVMLEAAMDPAVSEGDYEVLLAFKREKEEQL